MLPRCATALHFDWQADCLAGCVLLKLLLATGLTAGVLAAPVPQMRQTPLHKGGIDLSTGLYTRVNEDLIVPGAPRLVLRRTYLSGYRVSKQFGVGTMHDGEEYLIGDGERFSWAAVILAKGTRINFRRITEGSTLADARFIHDESPTDWYGAELSWTGQLWRIHRRDGGTVTYRACDARNICSILRSDDADGGTVYYRRNFAGGLLEMSDGAGRWIAFEYDDRGRITRAHASTKQEVRYEYDDRGRLAQVTAPDAVVRRYGYTDLDELAMIEEPGTSIVNTYTNGRVVRQINNYPGEAPLIFDFRYTLRGERLARTEIDRSDGSRTKYDWNQEGRAVVESRGQAGFEPVVFTYDRAPSSGIVRQLVVTCPNFGAGNAKKAVTVAGNEEEAKAELIRHCFQEAMRMRR